ncbi:hypothetical protein ACER0C_020050 [Sarotherodon galilaeus]
MRARYLTLSTSGICQSNASNQPNRIQLPGHPSWGDYTALMHLSWHFNNLRIKASLGQGLDVYPCYHSMRGRVHPGQVTSLSQGICLENVSAAQQYNLGDMTALVSCQVKVEIELQTSKTGSEI